VRSVELQPATFSVWHDRAVLHFLNEPDDRRAYARQAADAVAPGGIAIIAGFTPDGPTHCSGLPVHRTTPGGIAELFADAFELIDEAAEVHRTPWDAEQSFFYAVLRRLA
jgi:hypothetical protein